MTMKKKLFPTLFIFGFMFTGLTSVSAGDPMSEKDLRHAEKRLFQECVEDDSNDAAKCQCIVNTFQKELPRNHYMLIMDFIEHGLQEEDGDINLKDDQAEEIMKIGRAHV